MFVNGAGWGLAGGSQGGDTTAAGDPQFVPVLYDPEAVAGKKWTKLAPASVPRLYHSAVILTESGYVVTAGSEMQNYNDTQGPKDKVDMNCFPFGAKKVCTSPYEYRIERFTPPYLQTGKPRPEILDAPATLTFNSTFVIGVKKNVKIDRATFVRYSTSTHSLNTDQRFVELEIAYQNLKNGLLYLRAPLNGAIAPPGNWMLFVLVDGVPSVAKTINLRMGEATQVDIVNLSFKTSWTAFWTLLALIGLGWAF